jgi:hypothetical protein
VERFPDLVAEVPHGFARPVQGRLPLIRIGWAMRRPGSELPTVPPPESEAKPEAAAPSEPAPAVEAKPEASPAPDAKQ